jgi:hypothetical protein
LFLYFVWPTPYYYIGTKPDEIYRINRLTGVRYKSTNKGWMSQDELNKAYEEGRRESEDRIRPELLKIKLVEEKSNFHTAIFENPTSCDVVADVSIEYYRTDPKTGKEEWLCDGDNTDVTMSFFMLWSGKHTSLDLTPRHDEPDAIAALKPGTEFKQKIIVLINSASGPWSVGTAIFNPPFRLEFSQTFIHQ